ncbi:acyl-CoA synthetase [Luteimonas yindakuii]|uniref:AMP-binding protein n=1 Tax=Luteimonas yindakuii TaxID=2565782 RepID=UPI0010A394A8|nr:AMP-binding protein [Luteimonas yindakuii]QCO68589.1 acyl-CoA synthetase [Luteimonas yindakuii]
MSAIIDSPARADLRDLPLAIGDAGRTIAIVAGVRVSLSRFLAEVRGLAARLPDRRYAVNLCEDRYRFLVAFCAVAARGQTTLLPPSRTRAAIDDVRAGHPDSYCLGDADSCGCDALAPLPHFVPVPLELPQAPGGVPRIPCDHVVAIGYTSGSTGAPKANPKRWRDFADGVQQNLAALAGLHGSDAPAIVATVPAQHMYGVEMSVLLPLLGGAAVHSGRPFFPDDIATALAAIDAPRLLVTTPVHLRALVESGVALPELAGIVSATAPLPRALAAAAEARFGGEVREMFGSTETCIIARRRTAIDDAWTPLPGVRLQPQPDGTAVEAAHLPAPVVLADLVQLLPDGRFLLRGRQADLLEIAGKRASLGDLTARLLAVPGVVDGVVVQLDEADAGGVRRIAALVVAPTLDEAAIHAALRASIDPVFLPRRLRRVDALPRNATGKLPRDTVLALLRAD